MTLALLCQFTAQHVSMLIHQSSRACNYLVRYCVGCIVENASYKISYRRFTLSFLLISSIPVILVTGMEEIIRKLTVKRRYDIL